MQMSGRFEVLPWFSPRLSVSLAGVLQGIGHMKRCVPGESIYRSPELFSGKLMYIRRGFVSKAILSPNHEDPLLVSLSGPGALCGAYENLYVNDRMPRRHWCATGTELLCVNAEMLLRICDQNIAWQSELRAYASTCAMSDRLGMMINHSAGVEERAAFLLLLDGLTSEHDFLNSLNGHGIEWVGLHLVPSRTAIAWVLNTSREQLGDVVQAWFKKEVLRRRSGRLWLRKSYFLPYWERMLPMIDTTPILR